MDLYSDYIWSILILSYNILVKSGVKVFFMEVYFLVLVKPRVELRSLRDKPIDEILSMRGAEKHAVDIERKKISPNKSFSEEGVRKGKSGWDRVVGFGRNNHSRGSQSQN